MHSQNDAIKNQQPALSKILFISIAALNLFSYYYSFKFGFLFFKNPNNIYFYGIPFFIAFIYSIYSLYVILLAPQRKNNKLLKPYIYNMWIVLFILAIFTSSILFGEHQTIEYITDFHGQTFGAEYVYPEFILFTAFLICAIGEIVFIDMLINIIKKNTEKLRFNIFSFIAIILFALIYYLNMPRDSFNG